MKQIKWKPLVISLAISLGAGLLGTLLSGSMRTYETTYKPSLAPPGWLFPVVWTILYVLMGIAAYLVSQSKSPHKEQALQVYAIQLALNVLWSPLFFGLERYFLAFIVLILLWIAILATIRQFAKINPRAGRLLIPYLLWVTFAGYLNLAIALNMS